MIELSRPLEDDQDMVLVSLMDWLPEVAEGKEEAGQSVSL